MIKKWFYYLGLVVLVAFLSLGFKPVILERYDWFHVDEDDEVKNIVLSEEEVGFTVNFPFTGKSYAGFKQAIAKKESQGKYKLINSFGYIGKYQFGSGTLRTIGIHDITMFINNPKMQESAFKVLLSRNKWELRKEIKKFEGTTINGIKITESGILAAAHLGGSGAVRSYLKSNGKRIFRDGFGTSIVSYMENFAGYDTSDIIPDRQAKVEINR